MRVCFCCGKRLWIVPFKWGSIDPSSNRKFKQYETPIQSIVGDDNKMADCELCTRARPLLFPIKAPVHNLSYPEGAYKGVCDICLEHLEKGWQERFGAKPEDKK